MNTIKLPRKLTDIDKYLPKKKYITEQIKEMEKHDMFETLKKSKKMINSQLI